MTADAVRHLGCPACGATLARGDAERVVRCRNCGSRSVLTGVEPVARLRVEPRVPRDAALTLVREALRRWPVHEAASAAAAVSCELFLVPLREVEGIETGTVIRRGGPRAAPRGRSEWTGDRRRFWDDAGNEIDVGAWRALQAQWDVDTCVVLRAASDVTRAGGPDDWGLDALDLHAVLDDAEAEVVPLDAPRPPGHVLPLRDAALAARGADWTLVGRDAAAKRELLARSTRIVHLPVWVVRLRVDRHPYVFVVDAFERRILAGRAPEAPRRGAMFLVFAGAYAGLPLGKLVAVLADGGIGGARGGGMVLRVLLEAIGHSSGLVLLLPLFLLVPLAYAWGEFRYRGEVVFSPDGPRVTKPTRPLDTGFDRFIDRASQWVERSVVHGRDE